LNREFLSISQDRSRDKKGSIFAVGRGAIFGSSIEKQKGDIQTDCPLFGEEGAVRQREWIDG